jgi:MoxR-like ATPase
MHLPSPFLVIATRPIERGTFPLPEAPLDLLRMGQARLSIRRGQGSRAIQTAARSTANR